MKSSHCRAKRAGNDGAFPVITRSLLRYALATALTIALSADVAFAQDRVPVRPRPKAGQVIHVTTEQEIVLRTGEKADEPGPSQVHNKNRLAYTQTNGTFNSQGQLEAKVTIEKLELDESLSGRPRGDYDTASVNGREFGMTLDQTGKLLSLKVPPDISQSLALRLTQLIAGAYSLVNYIPAVELRVGEDTTASSELPMRLPGSVAAGPLQARTTLTLRAIDHKDHDRIAHLRTDVDVATETSQVKVTGGGTIDVNVDKGFVSATDIEWKMSGTVPATTPDQQSPPFYGSVRIAVSAN
jgi:hypothetical protein